MKRAAILVTVLAAIAGQARAQITLSPNGRSFLTADQLVTVAGSDSAAAEIVSRALAYQVRLPQTESIVVIGAQIREHWLPGIPGVQFRRLGDDDARTYFAGCGAISFVHSFTLVAKDAAVITIAKGNKCSSGGTELRFNRTADGWRVEAGGRGGFAGGISHCGCP